MTDRAERAYGDDELEVWARVLPYPQAGTSGLRYLHSLALMRAQNNPADTEAMEAARRLIEFDPVHGDQWGDALCEDAVTVARAYVQQREAVI